ncbi:hypothetical protein [Streptomyces sp. NPDC005125]
MHLGSQQEGPSYPYVAIAAPADGIVRRVQLGPPVSTQAYELLERGRQLEPALTALARWGAGVPESPDGRMSTDAFMLLLKASYRAPGSDSPPTAVRVVIGTDAFDVAAEATSIEVGRGMLTNVGATMHSDVATLRDLIFTDMTILSAIADQTLQVSGDQSVAERFLTLFEPPQP